jgi:tRNA threonylcarbamoyladenosine biosynthesis protein TsaB
MRLLAIEAGGPVLGAALFNGTDCLSRTFVRAPQRQTESLAPLVLGLLQAQAWEPASLQAVACGVGPGSFTGLRSSLAFGQGLALAISGLQLWGVPTLHSWAEAFAPAEAPQVCVLLDGRRGQAYRGQLARLGAAWADQMPAALLDLGPAREAAQGLLLSDLPELGPQALDSAALACAVGRLALAGDRAPWEPLYLRRSEAEILWEKLHPKA